MRDFPRIFRFFRACFTINFVYLARKEEFSMENEHPTQLLSPSALAVNRGQIEGLPKNPRLIRDARFEKLKRSLTDSPEFMELRPVIAVSQGEGKPAVVICGNMRLRACLDLGWAEIPTIVLPSDTPVEKLREYAIKDNVPYGETDWDVVANEWDTSELEGWGFEMPEDWGETPTAEEDGFTEEDAERAEAVCKTGDVWKLGVHRLMCGDSTDAEAVATLMGGERADICFTSPPYNVGNFSMGERANRAKRAYMNDGGVYLDKGTDSFSDEDYKELINKSLSNALANADDVLFNIGLTAGALKGTALFIGENAEFFGGIICWKKHCAYGPAFDTQHGILRNIQEPIYCFNKRGTRKFAHPQWAKGYCEDNFFESKNASGNEEKTHHATFPVELPSHFIEKFTEKSVLDLFGGTGTTLIAAEQLNRRCFMMELDPHYCDVIIARWEKLTGRKAEKMV